MAEVPAPPSQSPLLQHPVLVAFAVMVLFGLLRLVWAGSGVLLLGFLSVLVATLLSYPIDFLTRFVPRVAALLLTLLMLGGALVGLVFLIVPVVTAEFARLLEAIPVAMTRVEAWWGQIHRAGPMPQLPAADSLVARLVAEAEALVTHAVPFALSVGSVVLTVLVLFVLALFLAYSPASYLEGLRALVPREGEPLLDELWRRLSLTLRHWTAGILGSMLVMGVLAAVGLFIAGIDGWFLLGILTFLGTFVPYVGAIASAVPGLLIGLARSPLHMLYAAVVYGCVHVAEGYLVSPLIMRHTVRLRPATLLFWQLFSAAIFGLPGVVVATPLLACVKVAVGYLYIERRLGKEGPRP